MDELFKTRLGAASRGAVRGRRGTHQRRSRARSGSEDAAHRTFTTYFPVSRSRHANIATVGRSSTAS